MDDTAGKGITASELKELRRVFDYLADYVPKKKIYKQLKSPKWVSDNWS